MKVSFVGLSEKRKSTDLFAFASFEGSKLSPSIKKNEPTYTLNFEKALKNKRFEGKSGQLLSSYSSEYKESSEIIVLGLGDKKTYTKKSLEKTIGRIFGSAKNTKSNRVRILADSFVSGKVTLADVAEVCGELSVLSNYSFDLYKRKPKDFKKIFVEVELLLSKKTGVAALAKVAERAAAIASGAILTRNLINEPANIMNAPRLAQDAKKMAKAKKLSCQVLGYSEIKKLKMGGVLGVNQGAKTPPAFIIMEHGKKHKSKGTVCLVGKGVTFDTGGLSIKPSKGMEKMKYDMSGGAAVIGAMSAVADLNLPMHVVGLVPAVENAVSKDSIRPGDILTMMNGKTVEVLNTDAEGRLILADALAYSEKYKPKAIIDMATLTGMALYTFGNQCCAVMGNDSKLIGKIKSAGDACGQRAWELPMYDEYSAQLKSHHADLFNIGGTYGGTITAAKFLEEFVPAKTPWAHLDIAGVAWCDSPRYDCPVGGTGFGVKLVIQTLTSLK